MSSSCQQKFPSLHDVSFIFIFDTYFILLVTTTNSGIFVCIANVCVVGDDAEVRKVYVLVFSSHRLHTTKAQAPALAPALAPVSTGSTGSTVSIDRSIDLSIYISIYLSIYLSLSLSLYLSMIPHSIPSPGIFL